ncbi:MAG: deoxyribodipyrimidine photo-lyase [Acidobacteriaceae bacterium]
MTRKTNGGHGPGSAANPELPSPLRKIAEDPRVSIRRGGLPHATGKCVVYWMQRAQRGVDNAALDTAIHAGNELGLPVVVFFSAIANFPNANLRHYVFLQQGLRDVEDALAERGVGFVVRRPPHNSMEKFAAEVGAALVIGDENPTREPERWRRVLAGRLRIPYWTVDADVVVPSKLFQKGYYALHIFRAPLYAELPRFLVQPVQPQPAKRWDGAVAIESFALEGDITQGWRQLDRSVLPVETFRGGNRAAMRRLQRFIEHQLNGYEQSRRHPEQQGTSQLSPYLHFGHISPLTIALAAQKAVEQGRVAQASYDAYIGELIGWRELCVNFVQYTQNYDTIECADPWAAKTLREHVRDKRDPLYTLEQLEKGETYDELWNASQLQMVRFGWMHNIMRMYWAKKILEWSPNPAKAFESAVYLNDKYEMDGREPGGYGGIAWAIAGKFDRAWSERPIFGKIRYMSGASTGRKFNSKRYIALIDDPEQAVTELYGL